MKKKVLLIQSTEQDSKKRKLEESSLANIHNIFNPSTLCLSNLMLEVVKWLEVIEVIRMSQVCRRFKILFYHQRIWKRLCPPEIVMQNSPTRNYRLVFRGKYYSKTIRLFNFILTVRIHDGIQIAFNASFVFS